MPDPSSTDPPPTAHRPLLAPVAVGVVLTLVAVETVGRWTSVRPLPTAPAASSAERDSRSITPEDLAPDDRFRRQVVGAWEDDYQGKRTMILLEDGTGTMLVELSGWRAALSAPRLRFDMVWSVEQGRLKKRTIGGEPEAQVALILKTMGDRVDEPILELTEDRLVLLDRDGATRYHWRRKPSPP